MFRQMTGWYAALLRWLLAIAVGILIFPVSLQIFSRYTELIPSYIWTEEMARFLFVWMIMIGAMLGIREGRHFEVDVWPRLAPRPQAALRLVSNLAVLGVRAGVRLGGHRVHALRLEPHLRARRAAAVADPHRLAAHRRHLAAVHRRAGVGQPAHARYRRVPLHGREPSDASSGSAV